MSVSFRQLDYQERVLDTLNDYLDVLNEKKARVDKIASLAAAEPDLDLAIPDFVKEAWVALKTAGKLPHSRAAIPFSRRIDGCGRPVPNAVLKVPTAGGKTWLAILSVSCIIGRYLDRNTGFVLWIVPSEAIYTQTLKRLKDRQHPYRQALDRAAAGHAKVMEKTDRLDARDVEDNLCVMLLMLQSANRETQDSLKMFQDRGDIHRFFPSEGEQQAHKAAIDKTPNLDAYNGLSPMVKDSLGNALRVIRPVVILDEGHRVISELAYKTLYGFNPCFVLELTATPKDVQPRGGRNPRDGRFANVLVEVRGHELDREGMIKMPLNLDPKLGNDWKETLNAAFNKLRALDKSAKTLRADTGHYIRPIMLVQVERTGADQRESRFIHAEDVKDWLMTAGLNAAEIAIKTAEQNDLAQPENQDLLSPKNRIRVIITKQALQEGWDCPYAYVLCALAASSNEKAMTQLLGRILRQPGAVKTGIKALDECYVITHRADTATIISAIKRGLEQEGLGDLVLQVNENENAVHTIEGQKIERRADFAFTEIYLPKVMVVEKGEARELDYETDILSYIDWRDFDPAPIAENIPDNAQAALSQLQRVRISDEDDAPFVWETKTANTEFPAFDHVHAVRVISDIVTNPFVGREVVGKLLDSLKARGFDDDKVDRFANLITAELRRGLDRIRTLKAEMFFKSEVKKRRIQFRLRLDGRNWRMPDTMTTSQSENARQLVRKTGDPLRKSLFANVYEDEFNKDEQDVAVYLDGEKTLSWWHRNVARSQYGIQGWKKAKIYPDFIFAVQTKGVSKRITVLETKGDQLDNLDTAYKRDLLAFLSSHFAWDDYTPAGELELVQNNGDTVHGTLILMSEWKSKLPNYLKQV